MVSYSFIDNIQAEKANARARYKRYNTIAKIFKVIEVFIALALLSWSSSRLPSVFKVSAEYLYVVLSYMLNQHVVFLVGNVIVVLCYVLSCHTETKKEFGDQEVVEESRFSSSSFVKNTDSDSVSYTEETVSVPVSVSSHMEKELPSVRLETSTEQMGQIQLEGDNEKKAGFYENETSKTESEVAAEMAIKEAAKRIERFKRTQSAKLKREMSMKPSAKRELRRSATDTRRSPNNNGCRGSRVVSGFETNQVERLSNEEFRLAVEAFILKQQSFLKEQQTMVEN